MSPSRQTPDTWERFAAHRRKIQALISAVNCSPGSRLCVLGAGHCNDIDLRLLEREFAEIHLADLDRDAIEAGMARQRLSGCARVTVHAPCDLTNQQPLASRFDLVLSSGLITQMFQSVEDLGLDHEATIRQVLALRRWHLRMLFDLTKLGGSFILVTDVVSTATAPQLRNCTESQLGSALVELIETRNFFTGTNPSAIWKEVTEDPEFSRRSRSIKSHEPWLWSVTSAHDYLTWGMTVRLKP